MRFILGLVIGAILSAVMFEAVGQVPQDAKQWRNRLTREARLQWGLDAPVATFAAQVHAESYWRPDARSHVGAEGLAQFMPRTATWLAGAYKAVGPAEPRNPAWALRALVTYDRHLWESMRAESDCDRMAKTLSGYNGGPGWVRRDETLARSRGLNAGRWWGHVETVNAGRSAAAWTENRGYPRRILRDIEARYIEWGVGSCTPLRRSSSALSWDFASGLFPAVWRVIGLPVPRLYES